ncbi:MAG TPA: TonB-dependent receptor, partial [bacterium (Candidatus Stahlbacteria)]|nr:TonB-dependent receptor [Candidatus Stahlbacteria bacterium]
SDLRTRAENDILWFKYHDRQSNDFTANIKVSYSITPAHKLKLSYRKGWSRGSWFDWRWKNIPDSTQNSSSIDEYINLSFTHTLSPSTFYTFNFGRLKVDYSRSLRGRTPPEFWHWDSVLVETPDTSYWKKIYIGTDYGTDTNQDGFIDIGAQGNWRGDLSYVWTGKLDLTSQVNPKHLIKFGVEVRYNDLLYTDIQYAGSYYFPGRDSVPGPWPEYGLYRWVFHTYPIIGSAYLQDKIELEGLIVNVGVRADFFTPGETVYEEDYIRRWKAATGMPLEIKRYRMYFSPRLGISHPISERTVMYFNYGRFNQLPELQYFYRDPWTGTWVGNPNLRPELTTAYEFGFAHQIASNIAIDIKSYSKDIADYVGMIKTGTPPVWVWVNRGYGRARGIEFQIQKRYSEFTSGNLSYTYQWATGYASSAFMEYDRSQAGLPLPIRENRLDWDQRHAIVLSFNLEAPKGEKPLGILPDRWGANLLWKFGSGFPYTPAGTDIVITENTATAPYTSTFDLKVRKEFSLGRFEYSIFADVLNLFDRKNVSRNYGFNTWTGHPYIYGDVNWATKVIWSFRTIQYLRDPRMYPPGRQIKLGIKVNW